MFFIGYHGTSEVSAQSIIAEGVRRDRLPETGQIGPGFYVAKTNGTLPQWGAEWATQGARGRMTLFQRIVSAITGDAYNPLVGDDVVRTVLKIYSTRPLKRCKWSVMNPQDLNMIRAMIAQNADGNRAARAAEIDNMVAEWSRWLQMVVAPEELGYLVAQRDDGIAEDPNFWQQREAPTRRTGINELGPRPVRQIKEAPF